MEDARLTELLNAWLDGCIQPEEKLELEEMLISSASARRQFWEQTSLHGALYEAAKLEHSEHVEFRAPGLFAQFWRMIVGHWAICTSTILLALAAALFLARPKHAAGGEEMTTASVAVLTDAVGVKWGVGNVREAGSVLEPGVLKIEAGLLRIEFYSGARVLLEGPAELKLISRSEAFCARGKLTAEVPPQARGFRVGSPQMTVVDLGTAFGLDVNKAGAQMHVFEGEVQLSYPQETAAPVIIKEGNAVAVDAAGQRKTMSADEKSFGSARTLEARSSVAQKQRYDLWRSAALKYENDPSLLLYFDFEKLSADRRSVPNDAFGGSRPEGSLVGCELTDGRWPGKRALEFKRISDRVRILIGGEYDSVTLMASLRVDSIEHKFNSLMLSDGFEAGGLHWQIMREGSIRLGVGNGDPKRTKEWTPSVFDYDSPVVFTPEQIGRWVHLAVVYDSQNQTVTHYFNGKQISVSRFKGNALDKIRIESADIGNWNNSIGVVSTCPIRNFRGRIDEFAFFSRALGAAEIGQLYRDGSVQPPQEMNAAALPGPSARQE